MMIEAAKVMGAFPAGGWGVGIAPDASWMARAAHPWMHTGVIHAVVNCYVLLQLTFFCDVSLRKLAVAYLIACLCPASVAMMGGQGRVVGMSGVVYALMGMMLTKMPRRLRLCGWIAAYLLMGYAVGGVAVVFHLYCLVIGWGISRVSRNG